MPRVKIDKKWLLNFIEEEQSSYQHRINSIEEETIKLNNKKNKTKSDIEQLKRLNNDFYWFDGRFAALTKIKSRIELMDD